MFNSKKTLIFVLSTTTQKASACSPRSFTIAIFVLLYFSLDVALLYTQSSTYHCPKVGRKVKPPPCSLRAPCFTCTTKANTIVQTSTFNTTSGTFVA